MGIKKIKFPKIKGGARLTTGAERNAIAKNIKKATNAWAKNTLRG